MEMIRASLLQRRADAAAAAPVRTAREEVAAHAADRIHGVGAQIAHRRTMAFYRSSGNTWTSALS